MVSNINYNYLDEDIIEEIKKNPEKAKYLNYTQVKEFYKLDIEDMNRITRQISTKAQTNLYNGEYSGMYIDYTGDIFYYKVDENNTFGVTSIKKYNEISEEAYTDGIKE